jgi:mono/diheme cytochrome c family protein
MLRFLLFSLATLLIRPLGASAETLLERGSYLVNAVMACDGCHTPRTPSAGLVMEKRLAGGTVLFDLPAYTVRGSNITPDRETGIGAWSDDDIKRALIDGVRPNGVPLAPSMPFAFYKIMTPRDLDAVVAYIRSVAPIRNEAQIPEYKAEMHIDLVPGAERSIGDEVPSDPVKRGMYLATLAHCMECHSRKPDNTQDYQGWWGKGGATIKGPWGQVIVRNISSHKEKGIGGWSDDEIKRSLTHEVGRDGRAFKLPMARQMYYSKLSPTDLDAIVAWVRTIPPIE